jgi:spermidine/putrescine transport system permease protein
MANWGGTLRILAIGLGLAAMAFLYLPIATLVLYSFNASQSFTFPVTEFTTAWYTNLASNGDLLRALKNSFLVAAGVVPLTLFLGVPAAYALSRFPFRGSEIVERVFMLPLMIPGLITGLSILLLLKQFNLGLSLWAVVLGHTVAWLPTVITQVFARLRRFDVRVEEASQDLGAGPVETFIRVALPNLKNAVVGSALLVFILSFDEIAITFLLTGTETTLPMYIWASLRRGVTPELCAIATLMVVASAVLVLTGLKLSQSQEE